MSESTLAPLYTWLIEPLEPEVQDAIARLRCASDVQHVAVMPDVHLAADVCVGVAIGTTHLIYPQAVGGDILGPAIRSGESPTDCREHR